MLGVNEADADGCARALAARVEAVTLAFALSNYKPSLRMDDVTARFLLDVAGVTLPRLSSKAMSQMENIFKRLQDLAFSGV